MTEAAVIEESFVTHLVTAAEYSIFVWSPHFEVLNFMAIKKLPHFLQNLENEHWSLSVSGHYLE